jgi:threonine aldolase
MVITSRSMAPIDLRSDTVTKPTPEMRRAMAEAEVGDDVYGEDPTVNRLEQKAAEMLGKEAALFVPSGTMGNAIAVRLLTGRGDEVLVERRSHVVRFELAGMSEISGVMPRMVDGAGGHLAPEQVRAAVAPHTYYKSDVKLVVLENTHNLGGGTVQPLAEQRAVIAAARECGFGVHLDGARIWNAAVALGVPPAAVAEGADTVMTCLSKGLCAPAGSLVASTRERIGTARRIRKLLGGGMRQAGVLAAAGLVALETLVPRLAEDHANARLLGEAYARGHGVRLAPVETNIVVGVLEGRSAPDAVAALREQGVLATAMDAQTLRFTTHRDVSRADCERAAGIIEKVLD